MPIDDNQLMVSRTVSGLNFYGKSQFSEVFRGSPLKMEVEKLNDGSKVIRLFSSPKGVHHVSELPRKTPGTYNRRLFIQNKTMLKYLPEHFGPLTVEWTPGPPGEVYVRLPPRDKLPEPTPFVHRGGTGGPVKAKSRKPAVPKSTDPLELLDRAIRTVNEVLSRPDMKHVTLWYDAGTEMRQIPVRKIVGKIERTLGE